MLSIFRTNQVFVSLLLLFYGALLFSGVLILPVQAEAGPHGFLQHWVNAWLPDTPLALFMAIVIALFLQAFMLNLMEYNYRLDRELHMFPGVFFMLFSAMVPGPDALLPVFMANIFLFLAIYEIMGTFKQVQAAGSLFNGGLFLGVACLFYPSYAVFLLVLFSGLNILRGFQFRERVMVLVGVVVAYYLTGVTAFLTGHWTLFTELQGLHAYGFLDLQAGSSIPYSLIPWAVFLVILIFQHPQFMQNGDPNPKTHHDLVLGDVDVGCHPSDPEESGDLACPCFSASGFLPDQHAGEPDAAELGGIAAYSPGFCRTVRSI
ncbi:MAG: hypothetical protein IPH16_08490 [Haliscomenobacter sp.]|nr:hypothetical protein [Haliscomenobacter sp.]